MLIYNKEIDEGKVTEIIGLVRKKRELMYLDDDYIKAYIKKYLEQNAKAIAAINESPNIEKNYFVKALVKFVREKAHSVYGMFQEKTIARRQELLDKLIAEKSREKKFEIIKDILKTHVSTKARVSHLEEMYDKIFSMTGLPDSILDLGCGMNPLTVPFMGLKDVEYIASDFNEKDMEFIQQFFSAMKIHGVAVKLDLLKDHEKLKEYDVDACFLFNVLDSLESIRLNVSYEIMKSICAKYVIVSFPLKSLTGKKEMKLSRRNWFEKVLVRTGHDFEAFEFGNELFYIAKKSKRSID